MFRRFSGSGENVVKRNLIEGLIDAVKQLQLKYSTNQNDTLKNDDVTNGFCYYIEGIFLHGLKPTFFKSISTALKSTSNTSMRNLSNTHRLNTTSNNLIQPSYWEFLLVYCHSELIEQIHSLSQINTDIGKCRAWLRIVLNDGLFFSYMQLIVNDKKILRDYYGTNSFLRDTEKCELMKNYIVGIESYQFELAFNSSLLNYWNKEPLAIVGLGRVIVESIVEGVDVAEQMEASKDLQVISALQRKANSSTSSSPSSSLSGFTSLGKPPLLQEEDAIRLILSSKLPSSIPVVNSSVQSMPPQTVKNENENLTRKNGAIISKDVIHHTNVVEGPAKSLPVNYETEQTKPKKNLADNVKTSHLLESEVVLQSDKSELNEEEVAVPESPEKEQSYAALFGSYGQSDSSTEFHAPITIGSFLERDFFQPFAKTEETTTISSLDDIQPDGDENQQQLHKNEAAVSSDNEIFEQKTKQLNQTEETVARDFPRFLYDLIQTLPNETGLDSQNYKCKGCQGAIGMIYGEARICGFSGNYYCSECHLNEVSLIPSRILLNWDFRKYPVCRKAKQFINEIVNKPIFDLSKKNPFLYVIIDEFAEILKLRTQLKSVCLYLKVCKNAELSDYGTWPEQHLYETIHSYTLDDLLNIQSGALFHRLCKFTELGKSHIFTCICCRQRGFICELCRNINVIFPFQLDKIYKCPRCGAVYHSKCKTAEKPCPRCERWNNQIIQIEDQETQSLL